MKFDRLITYKEINCHSGRNRRKSLLTIINPIDLSRA